MNEIKKRFDYLFERMSKADRSLNKPLFYEELDKAIEQAREEERQFFADELIDGFDKKYQEICSKHKIKRETPNTLFHDIIKEKINE